MLPVKKIFVDTAFKTPDSRSNSDFRFELAESLTMPENCVFYVDDVCVPHSWYTVEPGVNDRLYVHIGSTIGNVDIAPDVGVIVTLPSKIYTGADLAAEISLGLNAASPGHFVGAIFAVTYDAAKHTISIASLDYTMTFQILTTGDLATKLGGGWFGANYDARRPNDINGDMLKQTEGSAATHGHGNPWTSGVISLQPIRSLYLYSPNLGSFHTLGPSGEASIIKAIPVTAGPNHMIFDQVMSGNDYLDCSKQTLRMLEFQLKDVHGNLVPLHGSHLSFSLVFDIVDTSS